MPELMLSSTDTMHMAPGEFQRLMAMARAGGQPPRYTPREPAAILGGATPAMTLYEQSRREAPEPFVRAGSTAVISVDGPIFYTASVFNILFGGMSNANLVHAAYAALEDPDIERVVLDLHTPGGECAGMDDLISAFSALASAKTLVALVHDKAASAGYWLACCADRVVATPSASMGGIGTIAVAYDESALYERQGVRPVVFTDAPHKALGNPGVAIDDAMVARESAHLAAMSVPFRASVSKKTGISDADIVAMAGAMYHAGQALSAGLCDEVRSSADFYAAVTGGAYDRGTPAARTDTTTSGRAVAMSTETPTMASVDEMYEQMDDEQKKEMRAKLEAEFAPEEEEPTPGNAEGKPEDEQPQNAEAKPEDEQPSAVLSAAEARAELADFELSESLTNKLIVQCMEQGWDKTTLLRKTLLAQRDPANQSTENLEAAARCGEGMVGGGAGTGAVSGSARARFDAAVQAEIDTKGVTRAVACRNVTVAQPGLQRELLAEAKQTA